MDTIDYASVQNRYTSHLIFSREPFENDTSTSRKTCCRPPGFFNMDLQVLVGLQRNTKEQGLRHIGNEYLLERLICSGLRSFRKVNRLGLEETGEKIWYYWK